ncbi:hypothetical protein [Geodermatophilus sp. CPCC 206100]|uniref:hypothetical protein n=1 Tax=Geodermatophilus sp. CPCC 206100 TaxID=3020054 RepID=UPI003AFFA2BA
MMHTIGWQLRARLNPVRSPADPVRMDTAYDPTTAYRSVTSVLPPEPDVTSLLPGPDSVLAHLAERLAVVEEIPDCLIVLGLHRPDVDGPAAAGCLAAATSIVASSVRGDDWLGRSGPNEFALVLSGGIHGAVTAAARVVGAISRLGVPGLGVCAGVTLLVPGVPAREVLLRATTALANATAAGTGAVCVS